jgi:hypothetical protein
VRLIQAFKKYAAATIIGAGVSLTAWGLLFCWAVVRTVYSDHQSLVSANSGLAAEGKTLTTENKNLKAKLESLANTPPKIVTKTLPAHEPEKQCWLSNHFGFPNSTVKGAVTASAAILHCNYKVDAPFVVQVEFDRDFIPGALVLPGSGVMTGLSEGKQGLVFVGQVQSPALLSNQLPIVTVYGTTDQYPRALRGVVKPLQ